MNKQFITILSVLSSFFAYSQVGINTSNPQGIFNIDGAKDNPATGTPSVAQQVNDFTVTSGGNVGVGTTTPDASAKLDVLSNSLGFLPPRMTTTERNSIAAPAEGLIIYNKTEHCLNLRNNNDWMSLCGTPPLPPGTVTGLSCSTASNTGNLTSGIPVTGASSSVPYTGGNGGTYPAQTVTSTGITGLTATRTDGTLSSGSGSVSYTITGTASGPGTASFAISLGGQSCTLAVTVQPGPASLPAGAGTLTGKICFDVVEVNDNTTGCGFLASRSSNKSDFSQTAVNTQTYTYTPTAAVSNIRFQYINTNGTVITGITGGNPGNNINTPVTATVSYNTGLNALASGHNRTNALTADIYVIYNDNASGTGTDRAVKLTANVKDCDCCGANVAPGVWKEFMCANLGGDQLVDPYTPSAAMHGAKYQRGRGTPSATQAQDQATTGVTAGYNSTAAPDSNWSDTTKTVNDPCPAGFRIPTMAQWQGVVANNTVTRTGTWVNSPTNYTTGLKFDNLTLPAAGYRTQSGTLDFRGSVGIYWASSLNPAFGNNPAMTYFQQTTLDGASAANRLVAAPIRCISQ